MKLGYVILLVGLSTFAFGKPARPGHIPGDRLVANLTERLQKDPNNANIYYLIGRAHNATFSKAVESTWLKEGEVEVFERVESLPYFYSIQGNIYPWDSKSAVKDTPDNRRHITEAIRSLRKSLDLSAVDGANRVSEVNVGLTHLTLACVFDCGALLAPKVKLPEPYRKLTTKEQWRTAAASEYLLAYQQSIASDSRLAHQPMFGLDTLVAYEAGLSYLRLRPASLESKNVQSGIEKLKSLPPSNGITPLILDLSGSKSLSSLLSPTCQVRFDLDGTGRTHNYEWVQPTTAFLVWDPTREGKITSGRQLFGNATWWMLWDNAYAALDALDDNGDGWLKLKELNGLALWYDRNGNGKSDPGEVEPIENTVISALRTSFDSRSGESFVSQEGVVLRDGRRLPTYDWVTKSIP